MANQKVNKKYTPLFVSDKRYIILMGGRGAGRSYGASQYATAKIESPEYFRCAIMRLVAGDIRNSIFQDIHDRIIEAETEDIINIKENSLIFTCGDNKINGIGFRKSSGDQKSKLKSLASYNCVIIEESDEVSEEDFIQLDDSLRKSGSDIKVIILLNPPSKQHWIIKRWFNLVPSEQPGFYTPVLKSKYEHNTDFIHTTYLDNIENLNPSTIDNWEAYKESKPDHYWNMIKGLVSEGARGRVFKDWNIINKAEYDALPYPEYYGLDFGFTNDPTALIGIKEHNNKVYFHELVYERGLVNRDPSGNKPSISQRLEENGVSKDAIIYCDSAEPKSIDELSMDDWNVVPAIKGADSVNTGIDLLLSKDIFYTEESENLAIEQQEYKWALNRDKEPTNKPIDKFNHLIDAGRYGVYTSSKESFVGFS